METKNSEDIKEQSEMLWLETMSDQEIVGR